MVYLPIRSRDVVWSRDRGRYAVVGGRIGEVRGCAVAPCAIASVVLALGACLFAWSRRRGAHGAVRSILPLVVLAGSAFTLGVTLRLSETVESARTPVILLPPEGQLVRIEATVATGFIERGFAVDLLARHLVKPTRFVGFVRDVVLVDDNGRRLSLGDPSALLAMTVFDARPECRVADRVTFVGTMRGGGAERLPGDARMREAAARKGIAGAVSVDSATLVRVMSEAPRASPLFDGILRVREDLRERLRDALVAHVPVEGDVAIRSMLVALVLGDAEDGYRSIESSFRAVGLSHILAISGFNLAVLGWVVGLAARIVSRDARVQAAACGLAALGALVLMAPAASAVRSALMAVVGASGGAARREWSGDAILSIAAITMLVVNPSDALDPGFQLSFACVLALRHLSMPIQRRWLAWMPTDDARRRHPAWIGVCGELLSRSISSGLAAFLSSAPIVLVHFGSLQPFGTLLTLLCAPLSTATLMLAYPKAMIGAIFPPVTHLLTWLLAWPVWLAAYAQVEIVELAIGAGAGSIAVGGARWWVAAAMIVALAVALRGRNRAWRVAAVLALSLLAVIHARTHARDRPRPHFEATMFAIGDGTTIAIESQDTIALFDGGSSSIGNVAGRVLLPWIDARGGCVDAAFISHPDLDHLSALADVTRYARIKRVYFHPSFADAARSTPAIAELMECLRARGVEARTISAGDSLRVGSATWHVLWPAAEFRSVRDNDMSLVLRVDVDAEPGAPAPRLLFGGDIETEPAARLAALHDRGEIDLRCDVLELPHHGSFREAVVRYIECADPRIILQSTAARRFRQDRFATRLPPEVRRFVTCRDGTISVRCGQDGEIVSSVLDGSVPDQMRPAGRTAARMRPRRIRTWRARAFGPGVASGEKPSKSLTDEAATLDQHPVARDAVATVVDLDDKRGIASGGHLKANGCLGASSRRERLARSPRPRGGCESRCANQSEQVRQARHPP